jgi:hypothetical protein
MGCGCLVLLIGLAFPRLAMFLLWLFSDWFHGVFPNLFVPIIGFLFVPYTTLWYSAIQNFWDGQWGFWQVLIMVLAVMSDLGMLGGAGKHRQQRS